jgi:Tfp pilus assembly protein PilF
MPRALYAVAAVYAALCVGLWPVPLLGLLHVESSAVVAGVGFFASGLAALSLFRRGEALGPVLGRLVALLVVPLGLLLASMLWRPNCGWAQGLGLFAVFTVPSVVLAVALAWALDAAVRRRRTWFVAVGLAVAALPVLWDLGLHPQFYTYNHVWGGVLGPIYDEELAVRPGLFWFRGLTLLWAAALGLFGARLRMGRGEARPQAARATAGALLLAVGLIGLAYAFAPRLGFNTPGWLIRERLGGHLATERFDIYYDPASLSPGELRVIADAHAYRYHQLWKALGVDVDERIATYLYRTYGPAPLRTVYATGDFERAYGVPLDTLAAAWEADVLAQPPDPEADELVARVFTRPSLFEQRCPHWVEPWKRAYRAGLRALAAGDADEAERLLERALADEPAQPSVLATWGRVMLAQGRAARVVKRLEAAVAEADTLAEATLWARLGDAYALSGDGAAADSAYERALAATPTYQRSSRAVLALRKRAEEEALAGLLGLEGAADRAARLGASEDPVARLLAGLLWAEAGDYAAAQRTLEGVAPRAVPEVEAERWRWLARFAHAADDRLGAIAYAERAAGAYTGQGATNAAAAQRDAAEALWWIVLREDPVLAPLPSAESR